MHRSIKVLAAVAAVLVAHVARGDGLQELPASPAAPYPVVVRLVVTPSALGERYFAIGIAGMPPTLGSPDVPVGRQALEAYGLATARMFQPAREGARAAQLLPSVGASGIDLDQDGWFAFVEHDVVLHDLAGAEVARWRVRGQGPIVGLGENAIPRAFAEATAIAARTFEIDFERPSGVTSWLAAQGITPGLRVSTVPDLPRRFTPATPRVIAPRAEQLVFAEFGVGAVGATGWMSSALTARAGWSGRPWLVQLAIDAWPREFVARPAAVWGEARARALVLSTGLDAGVQQRLTSHFEIAGGVGAALLSGFASAQYVPLATPTGSVDASDGAFGASASMFGAVRLNGVVPLLAFRYRLGLEVRKAFGTPLSFNTFGQTIASSGLSASAFLGIELPWKRGSGQ